MSWRKAAFFITSPFLFTCAPMTVAGSLLGDLGARTAGTALAKCVRDMFHEHHVLRPCSWPRQQGDEDGSVTSHCSSALAARASHPETGRQGAGPAGCSSSRTPVCSGSLGGPTLTLGLLQLRSPFRLSFPHLQLWGLAVWATRPRLIALRLAWFPCSMHGRPRWFLLGGSRVWLCLRSGGHGSREGEQDACVLRLEPGERGVCYF